jgi:hypothetical protein
MNKYLHIKFIQFRGTEFFFFFLSGTFLNIFLSEHLEKSLHCFTYKKFKTLNIPPSSKFLGPLPPHQRRDFEYLALNEIEEFC